MSVTTRIPKIEINAQDQEPSMLLQRPSPGISQDVRHVLARSFRDLYMKESLGPDIVKNLQVSKCSDEPYHERYVENLQQIYNQWQHRMEEAAMLERHIMQAQARAMAVDERNLNCVSKICNNYADLGLPPGGASFRSCIDSQLLRDHQLLTPEDYCTKRSLFVPAPLGPSSPDYAQETHSSRQHSQQNLIEGQDSFKKIRREDSVDLSTYISEGSEVTMEEEESVQEFSHAHRKRFPSCNAWKTYMGTIQRQIDKGDLTLLQTKANYLRNPRYLPPAATGNKTIIKSSKRQPKEVGIFQKPDNKEQPPDDVPVFIASPPVIVFRNYKVGQVYETTLELKNISTVLRLCRVVPPKSSNFSVGLGQFPGEKGLIAPGMSCHFPVRFAPDSLKDYDDQIVVQTQSPIPLIVLVQGRRPPPSLTMPSELDVGYCLVGGFQVTHFMIRNDGGPGCFCIMPRSAWPASNFKTVISNGHVQLPPFELRPSTLELDHGQTTVLEVIFQPNAIKAFTQCFTILCDNCHAKHFTLKGEGQVVKLEVTKIERGESIPLPGEMNDQSAQQLIKFDDLNPYTYTERTVSIKNCTYVELPFQWMVYKPQMKRPEADPSDNIPGLPTAPQPEAEGDRVPELESAFSAHPSNGVILPAETTEFQIIFAPPLVNEYHNVLHLLIQQVPVIRQNIHSNSQEDETPPDAEMFDELTELEPNDAAGELQFHDITTIELEVKGRSVPLNVLLHPYALYFPGNYLVGTTFKKLITMANHSFSTITFQWDLVHENEIIIEVVPPFGELDAGMAMDLELSITVSKPCHLSRTLFCYVLHLEEPLHLHIDAEIKGPEVIINEPSLNFGLVRLGDVVVQELTLTSLAQFITKWKMNIKLINTDSEDDLAKNEFTILPCCGELRPLEEKKIAVQFEPHSVRSIHELFLLEVQDGNTVSLSVFAEVQHPVVCLINCDIWLPEVYVGVPVINKAILYNQTFLPTTFKWEKPEGKHARDCQIEIEELSGELGCRQEHPVSFTFCAQRQGQFNDVRVPCSITGQEIPLFLNIRCSVQPLTVTFKTSESNQGLCEDQNITFGDVPLGQSVKRYLYICNQTAITADFSIHMENFPAAASTITEVPDGQNLRGHSPSENLNLLDLLNNPPLKTAAAFKTSVLSYGKGAAFLLQPSTGVLKPFEHHVIEITAFQDMWGQYSDHVVCKVGDLEPFLIPLTINVVGCPLNFQMTAANPNQLTIVRFGTLIAGLPPVTRSMRINNTSSFDIRVDWVVYNQKEKEEQVLDLVVAYGRPFPPRDSQGIEILPQSPPDSPDISSADDKPSSWSELGVFNSTDSDLINKNINKQQPKVIKLYLWGREGVTGFDFFDIEPRQLTISAHSYVNVQMSFKPPKAEEITKDIDYHSFALGYMSLDDRVSVYNLLQQIVNPSHP